MANWGAALKGLSGDIGSQIDYQLKTEERDYNRARQTNLDRQNERYRTDMLNLERQRVDLAKERNQADVKYRSDVLEQRGAEATATAEYRKDALESLDSYRDALGEHQAATLDWDKIKTQINAITESYTSQIEEAMKIGDEETAESLRTEMASQVGMTILQGQDKRDAMALIDKGAPAGEVVSMYMAGVKTEDIVKKIVGGGAETGGAETGGAETDPGTGSPGGAGGSGSTGVEVVKGEGDQLIGNAYTQPGQDANMPGDLGQGTPQGSRHPTAKKGIRQWWKDNRRSKKAETDAAMEESRLRMVALGDKKAYTEYAHMSIEEFSKMLDGINLDESIRQSAFDNFFRMKNK